jgi:hypothetical protein
VMDGQPRRGDFDILYVPALDQGRKIGGRHRASATVRAANEKN